MPALTSYTPYETLVFFQNVAEHGANSSSLQNISTTLNTNQLIRESSEYEASKFSPEALQHLYSRTIDAQQRNGTAVVNGDAGSTNPLKRKLSTSPPPSIGNNHEHSVQRLVDKLYAQFKSETIRELRQQERAYEDLQQQITKLESEVKVEEASQAQTATKQDGVGEVQQPKPTQVDGTDPVSAQLQADLKAAENVPKTTQTPLAGIPAIQQVAVPRGQPSPAPGQRASVPRSASGTPLPRLPPAPAGPQSVQYASPDAFNRTLPPPSPPRSNYGSLPSAPQAYPHQQQGQAPPPMLPPIHSLQRMPSHEGYPQPPRPPSQGRGSPMPQHPHHPTQHYPPYQQYQQPPLQGWPSHSPQSYPPQPYPLAHHYPPQPPSRYPPVHTPNQPPYQAYPHTAPVPYPNHQQYRGLPPPHYHHYPASASTTPVPRSQSRMSVIRSGSSTPWKRRATPLGFRPRSPTRLDREISPLSDHESAVEESPKRRVGRPPKSDSTSTKKALPRDKSGTPAADMSRSQSVISNASEPPDPPKRRVGRPPKVKAEPSTPAPATSDSEQQQKSSGRRGRPRAGTATVTSEPVRTTTKRKRDSPPSSPPPTTVRARSSSNVQPVASSTSTRNLAQYSDPNFVLVSKTFGKTTQIFLNEITSHKLGGIFAKPLTERDAPGYKSLVQRPQDLKSIKAAVSKGSRAAVAAIEEFEARTSTTEDDQDGDTEMLTPTPKTGVAAKSAPASNTELKEGPSENGFYLLHATEDLLPPKGIVNFSQLETELVRIFANAIMFNPLPTSERGFGRSLRLRKRGGELRPDGTRPKHVIDAEKEAEDGDERQESEVITAAMGSESEESASAVSSGYEAGIIADAREMYEDVERMVADWQASTSVSGTLNVTASTPTVGEKERHASISASSVAPDEEGDGLAAGMGTGSTRKRRRVGDR